MSKDSAERQAVIDAARRIHWGKLDAAIGTLECRAALTGEHGIYGELEALAAQLRVLREACTLLSAVECRRSEVGA